MTREILVSSGRCELPGDLRLVLDDDELHCDGMKVGIWKIIKRVKHAMYNRWGTNVHTLAGSISGIVYSICVEKREDSTMDCMKQCIESCFKVGNFRHPNLQRIVSGLDRGYDNKNVVAYITRYFGNIFGTAKRTPYNPYTYDQTRRGNWDKRIFMSKEGATLVDKVVAPIKDEGGVVVSNLVSIFYRNGHGGATLIQSTIPSHQYDEWDRIIVRNKEIDIKHPYTFYKPHQVMYESHDKNKVVGFQKAMHRDLYQEIEVITEDQNVWEWFCARMFSMTASAAYKYISIALKENQYKNTTCFQEVFKYMEATSDDTMRLDIEEIIPDFDNETFD